MLIVLEGVDGSGKTTLANLLSMLLDAEIIHATRETPNTESWFRWIIEEAKAKNIIADRFFWGQFAYQNREERNISWRTLGKLEEYLADCGGIIVYVTAPDEVIESRLASRNEELSVPLEILKERYERLVKLAFCSVLRYDTSNGEVTKNERNSF